jgi:hypothetical protein
MFGRFSGWFGAAALASATAILMQSPARAADSAGYAPGLPGPQIMLYLRWPVGVHGLGATTFGLRYEQASPIYAESATRFAAAMRHRSLVDLQFSRGVAPRMYFGPRVTWEMGRGELGPTQLVVPTWPMSFSGSASATRPSWLP